MGVYINGMEMPRDGIYRMGLIVKEGKIKAGLVKEESFADKDIEWFDCIPIQNHRNFVDKYKLLNSLRSYDFETCEDYRRAFEIIKRAPAIIPADKEEVYNK